MPNHLQLFFFYLPSLTFSSFWASESQIRPWDKYYKDLCNKSKTKDFKKALAEIQKYLDVWISDSIFSFFTPRLCSLDSFLFFQCFSFLFPFLLFFFFVFFINLERKGKVFQVYHLLVMKLKLLLNLNLKQKPKHMIHLLKHRYGFFLLFSFSPFLSLSFPFFLFFIFLCFFSEN